MEEVKKEEQVEEVKLIITLKAGSKYPILEGPLKNEALCLYMLKYAELSLIQHNNQPPKIEPVKGSMLNFARKRFHA